MNTKQLKQNFPSAGSQRSAFTLIELLLVMSIIAVLASLAVGVLGSAQEDARVAATQARVEMIRKLIETELEDYEVQRSPISFRNIDNIVGEIISNGSGQWDGTTANRRLHGKNLKRMITLDLIRAEMPDFRDGVSTNLGSFPTPRFIDYLKTTLGVSDPENNRVIIEAFQGSTTANVFRWVGWPGANDGSEPSINSAEVLYRILLDLDVDGTSGIDLLGNSAVGDTDGDRFLEVLDAWGDPLRFEFHQRTIVPLEQNVAIPTNPAASPRSGVWETVDPIVFTAFPVPESTDFDVVLPNLPSEISFFISSDKLSEIDGEPSDFLSSNNLPHLEYQQP